MSLRLVQEPIVQAGFWPWHLWRLVDDAGHPTGGSCCFCGRDIAIPPDAPAGRKPCLYCALDRGIIAAEDVPLGQGGDAP